MTASSASQQALSFNLRMYLLRSSDGQSIGQASCIWAEFLPQPAMSFHMLFLLLNDDLIQCHVFLKMKTTISYPMRLFISVCIYKNTKSVTNSGSRRVTTRKQLHRKVECIVASNRYQNYARLDFIPFISS